MTKIQWAQATWNPIVGCSVTSPGCKNCYAMRVAHRLSGIEKTRAKYRGLTKTVNGHPVWTGQVRLWEPHLDIPLRRRKPTLYFVNSEGDLFHPAVEEWWIDLVFAMMSLVSQHRFIVLTKHPERMREYLRGDGVCDRIDSFARAEIDDRVDPCARRSDDLRATAYFVEDGEDWPLPNVALGVSVEDQPRAEERVPVLLDTPARWRLVSAEPLLGPLNLNCVDVDGWHECFPLAWPEGRDDRHDYDLPFLDGVIAGGESGRDARPSHPAWHRKLRDDCAEAGVAFFFKQWGAWGQPAPMMFGTHGMFRDGSFYEVEGCMDPWSDEGRLVAKRHAGQEWSRMIRIGKADPLQERLDGVEHKALPKGLVP